MDTVQLIDAAALSGRQQAFALIASKCTAAQAQCLRQIRETRVYEQFGLTWEEFCDQHAGIRRRHADDLISRLDEFGDTYFKLSQLARVSPETYREIAGQLHDDVIEIDGAPLALIPENATRIRAGIQRMAARLREKPPLHYSVTELSMRLDAILDEVSRATRRSLPIDQLAALRGLTLNATSKFRALSKILEAAKPA